MSNCLRASEVRNWLSHVTVHSWWQGGTKQKVAARDSRAPGEGENIVQNVMQIVDRNAL